MRHAHQRRRQPGRRRHHHRRAGREQRHLRQRRRRRLGDQLRRRPELASSATTSSTTTTPAASRCTRSTRAAGSTEQRRRQQHDHRWRPTPAGPSTSQDGSTGNTRATTTSCSTTGVAAARSTSRPTAWPASSATTTPSTDRFTTDDGDTTLTLAQWRPPPARTRTRSSRRRRSCSSTPARTITTCRPTSPAADAGTALASAPDTPAYDLDANARPQGAAIDIGAYERVASGPGGHDAASRYRGDVRRRLDRRGGRFERHRDVQRIDPARTLSFVLRTLSGAAVPATVSYNDASRTATLTPGAALDVRGGLHRDRQRGQRPRGQRDGRAGLVDLHDRGRRAGHVEHLAADHGGRFRRRHRERGDRHVRCRRGGATGAHALRRFHRQLTRLGLDDQGRATGGSAKTAGGVLTVSGDQVLSAARRGRRRRSRGGSPSAPRRTSTSAWAPTSTIRLHREILGRVHDEGHDQQAVRPREQLGQDRQRQPRRDPRGYHVYRVQPVAGGYQFYLDDVLRATLKTTFPAGTALKAGLSARYASPKPA